MQTQPSVCEVYKHSMLEHASLNHLKMLMVLKQGTAAETLRFSLIALATGISKCYQQLTVLGHIIMSLDRKWHLYMGDYQHRLDAKACNRLVGSLLTTQNMLT